jgi:hypothetical protein
LNFEAADIEPQSPAWDRHGKLLVHVLTTRKGGIVAPRSGSEDPNPASAANLTEHSLNLCPISLYREHYGIVELFYAGELEAEEQTLQIRFLHRASEFLLDYQKNVELRRMAGRQRFWAQLDTFARHVHQTLQPKKVAYTIANDGRQLIGSDRVSVALRHGGHTRIEAISGQDTVDSRANMVRGMAQLADAVIHAGERLAYTGQTDDLPPRIEKLLREYLEESGTKTIFVLPLREPVEDADQQKRPAPRPFGALVVEQIEDQTQSAALLERSDSVVRHGSAALSNALRHNRVFLLPILHWLGDVLTTLRGWRLFKVLLVPVVLVAIAAALAFVPGDFRLEGAGRLLPEIRRNVFAGEDGIVHEVLVRHGDRVQAGDKLAVLENIDLAVQLQQSQAELVQLQDEYNIKSAQRNNRSLTEVDEIRLSGEVLTLRGKVDSLKRQIALLEERVKRLTVLAPMDGVITTWDVERHLSNRPVTKGNLLLNEADDHSPWILEIRMPEDRVGYVLRARQALSAGERLPVEFILATQPEERYRGWVSKIGERTEFVDDANVVLLTVELDAARLPPLRPGAEVRARINCGRRALGYVWFHELIEFVHARVLFLL